MLYQSSTDPEKDVKFSDTFIEKLKNGHKFIEESLIKDPEE